MLLAVFSDSHGSPDAMRRAVETRRPDHIVFLGDGFRDAERLGQEFPHIPLLLLRGNCDWNVVDAKESALFELAGVRIFAAHGHRHGVKMELDAFANSVHFSGAGLGLYGHTHIPRITETHGLTLMNPGSVGSHDSPSYGLVWLENGAFRCELVTDCEGGS